MAIGSILFTVLFISFYKLAVSVTTLNIIANTGIHPISPYIYGINYMRDTVFAKEIRLPFDRLGGNAVTRYNWKLDVSNHASDWFFENLPEDNPSPQTLPAGNMADRFVDKDRSVGSKTMLTIPLIGWTPKDRVKRCGFSVAKYGAQQSTDKWTPDCGNGMKTDGTTKVTGNDPRDTSAPINRTYATEWVQYLVKKFGSASNGGVLFYEMDNEYDLWPATHRDVRPNGAGAVEILKITEDYASAVKAVDPSAQILGPVGWGYQTLFNSGAGTGDRSNHGNIDFGAYYLQQLKALETKYKQRLVDYFDVHYYPQSKNEDAVRLRSTRSLWDPTYDDESWIKDLGPVKAKIQFIPRMKKLIADNYPGTKIAISEYNWEAMDTIGGGLAQADVLGIFGREGVDLASLWGPGKSTDPWAYAFRMFRNYDGLGSQFGDTSVTANTSDALNLSIYASLRSSDKHLIVLVINKNPTQAIGTKISISGFNPSANVKVYNYSSANLQKIIQSSATIAGSTLIQTLPSYSISLFDITPK